MLVRAIGIGFHKWIRRPGEVFEVPDDHLPSTWLEAVEPDPPPAVDDPGTDADAPAKAKRKGK